MISIIFTQSYPYDQAAEYTFIQPEIRHLLEKFEKVILVPRISKGKSSPLPSGVEVIDAYADFIQRGSRLPEIVKAAFSSKRLFRELRERQSISLYPAKIAKLILFSARAELTARWLKDFIQTRRIAANHCILYSYWFDHTATGLARTKQEFPAIKVVSRAHGFDIYEEYYYPYYWPYRRETLDALDVLFFASEAGRKYFCERFPEYVSKFETAHLGTADPNFLAAASSDGVFRIGSCAHLVPVKRVDLLLDGIAAAARLRPEQKMEWVHFGDGTGRKSLNRRMTQSFPSNVHGEFLGNVPNSEIMRYYRDQPVDVFVNVSSTEGGVPVAIQEAISCGIPVVATAVGGNPEVVTDKNGILLDPNPTAEQIASALLRIWDNPLLVTEMRKESRRIWQRSYNAEVNFRVFAERLKSIGED